METLSFILGVAAVITLVMVVVTFMNYMENKNLNREIVNLGAESCRETSRRDNVILASMAGIHKSAILRLRLRQKADFRKHEVCYGG